MKAKASIKLASDPAFPQRDLLLNTEEVRRRFSEHLGIKDEINIQRCERLRVKYSHGTSLRLLHKIQVGSNSHYIAARAFKADRSQPAFEQAERKAVNCGPILPVAHDSEIDTVYWTFPNDRKIKTLSVLEHPPLSFAGIFKNRWTRSRIVAYAPEKCVTAQCLSSDGQVLAYAKIYAEDERLSYGIYESLRKNIQSAKSNLRIPRALAYSEEYRILLLEPLESNRIADLRNEDRFNGFHQLGIALAALHSIPVSSDLPRFERLAPARLQKAAQIISVSYPDVASIACNLAEELCRRRDSSSESEVILHGDVHPKNGILEDDSVALIDLDQAGTGPAAADLGSLLASLRYSHLTGFLSSASARALIDAFLSGYCKARDLPDKKSLRWHTSAALLSERALRAVSRIRSEGICRLNEILIDSWTLLTQSDHALLERIN
jgi:aminoglycoside phosphotransferase